MRKTALLLALLLFLALPVCYAGAPEPSESPDDADDGASYLPIIRASFGIAAVLGCGILYIRRRKGYEPILQRRRRRR